MESNPNKNVIFGISQEIKPNKAQALSLEFDSILKDFLGEHPENQSFCDELKPIDDWTEIVPIHSLLSYYGSNFLSLGDSTLIKGKAKSRKTFALVWLVANYLYPDGEKFTANRLKQGVLWIDTEQTPAYVKARRECLRATCDGQSIDNVSFYSLRKYSPKQRVLALEYLIKEYSQSIDLLILDGIRDLITSINNEQEASAASSYVLNRSTEHNIHIVSVLHENKGLMPTDARGHIGTELTNKAETVLTTAVVAENKEFSTIKGEYTRNKPIQDMVIHLSDGKVCDGSNEFAEFESSVSAVCKVSLMNIAAKHPKGLTLSMWQANYAAAKGYKDTKNGRACKAIKMAKALGLLVQCDEKDRNGLHAYVAE